MSSFSCPFCLTNRGFVSFAKMFQHITLYHQNEPNFKITCDLRNTCGVLYRTYSAYKSHIYRQHSAELHLKEKHNNNFIVVDNQQQENINLDVGFGINNNDDNDALDFANDDLESILSNDDYGATFYNPSSSFDSIDNEENTSELLVNMKRSYISFILQLREEFLLPKSVTNIISTYILTLIHYIQVLLEKISFHYSADSCSSATSSFRKQNQKLIEFDQLTQTLKDICDAIEAIAKNDYQFIKNCEKYFDYSSAEEITVSSVGDVPERGYFIPIDKTLLSMLNSQSLVLEILENIQQQRIATECDGDLMFSIRDGYHGNKLDHDTLLLQLYLDDIGLTNPIGSKRDEHKMSMVYFSLEDVPDKYRSKIDYIQLVGICQSKILKVNIPMINSNVMLTNSIISKRNSSSFGTKNEVFLGINFNSFFFVAINKFCYYYLCTVRWIKFPCSTFRLRNDTITKSIYNILYFSFSRTTSRLNVSSNRLSTI